MDYRFSVTALLDSRVFDTFQVDLTTGDALVRPLDTVTVGSIFWFAEGIKPVQVLGITPAQHLAEKLHAICRDRGHRENNRVKDLFDVVLLLRQGVTAQEVLSPIGEVFAQASQTSLDRLRNVVPEGWRVPI
jgi:hypothetical protein